MSAITINNFKFWNTKNSAAFLQSNIVMKNILFLLLHFFAITAFAQNVSPAGEKLPSFKFTDLNGKTFTDKNIPNGKPFLIMYFDPGCDHCEMEAKWLSESIDKFKSWNLYFVSISDPVEIGKFRDRFFAGKSNCIFLSDIEVSIFKSFKNMYNTPTINVYKKDKTLQKQYIANVKPDIILKNFNKN